MLSKTIASIIVASALASATAAPAFAGGGEAPSFMTLTNPDGSSVTRTWKRDGGHIDTHRNPKGKVEKKVERKAKKKPGRSWASTNYEGKHITSVSNGNGTRTVITISPFGIGIGLSF